MKSKLILRPELMILGIVTLIYVAITFFLGIKIIAKYFEVNEKLFLYVGLSILGLATPWSGVAANFISIVLFDVTIPMELYFLLHGTYIPISSFSWLVSCLILLRVKPTTRKRITIIGGLLSAIVECLYLIIIFTDTTILGTPINKIQVDYAPFSELYLLVALIVMTVLGFLISAKAMKLEERELKLKGRLLFCAQVLFLFTALLEIVTPSIIILIFARILVMVCAILYYGGFVLPKWMERVFLKQKYHNPRYLRLDRLVSLGMYSLILFLITGSFI